MKQNDCVVNSVYCYLDTQPAAPTIRREICEVEATVKVETEWKNNIRQNIVEKQTHKSGMKRQKKQNRIAIKYTVKKEA